MPDDDSSRLAHMHKVMMTMGAQSLVTKWLKRKNINETLDSPEAEDLVIFAAKEIAVPELRKKWLRKVRGNGKDPRRVELVKKCEAAIAERYGKE